MFLFVVIKIVQAHIKNYEEFDQVQSRFKLELCLLCFVYIIQSSDMKFQNKQNRGNRVPRNRNPRNEGEEGTNAAPRKFKPNQGDKPDRPFKKRFIKRDQHGKPHGGKGKPGKGPRKGQGEKRKPEDRDLDRELRDYWVGQKGSKADADAKELARQKLDSEMDNYWKQKKDEANPKTD